MLISVGQTASGAHLCTVRRGVVFFNHFTLVIVFDLFYANNGSRSITKKLHAWWLVVEGGCVSQMLEEKDFQSCMHQS